MTKHEFINICQSLLQFDFINDFELLGQGYRCYLHKLIRNNLENLIYECETSIAEQPVHIRLVYETMLKAEFSPVEFKYNHESILQFRGDNMENWKHYNKENYKAYLQGAFNDYA